MGILERYSDRWMPEPNTGCFLWLGPVGGGRAARPSVKTSRRASPVAVARIVCEEEHGPPPTPKHHAAHATPRGCIGRLCVNGDHLRWATPKENSQDIPREIRLRISKVARQGNLQGPRNLAKIAGEKYYLTSKPCKRGHTTLRRTQDGACRECQVARRKARP